MAHTRDRQMEAEMKRKDTFGDGEEGLGGAVAKARGTGGGATEGFGKVPIERGPDNIPSEAEPHQQQDGPHEARAHSPQRRRAPRH